MELNYRFTLVPVIRSENQVVQKDLKDPRLEMPHEEEELGGRAAMSSYSNMGFFARFCTHSGRALRPLLLLSVCIQ